MSLEDHIEESERKVYYTNRLIIVYYTNHTRDECLSLINKLRRYCLELDLYLTQARVVLAE